MAKFKISRRSTASISNSQKKVPDFKKLFKQRKQDILERHIKAVHEKHCALDAARKRSLEVKEKLTQDIIHYGLWQTREEIISLTALVFKTDLV